jgi:hypothetical protein
MKTIEKNPNKTKIPMRQKYINEFFHLVLLPFFITFHKWIYQLLRTNGKDYHHPTQ